MSAYDYITRFNRSASCLYDKPTSNALSVNNLITYINISYKMQYLIDVAYVVTMPCPNKSTKNERHVTKKKIV